MNKFSFIIKGIKFPKKFLFLPKASDFYSGSRGTVKNEEGVAKDIEHPPSPSISDNKRVDLSIYSNKFWDRVDRNKAKRELGANRRDVVNSLVFWKIIDWLIIFWTIVWEGCKISLAVVGLMFLVIIEFPILGIIADLIIIAILGFFYKLIGIWSIILIVLGLGLFSDKIK